MINNEIWKPIPNYENRYEISNYGNVRSLDRTTKDTLGRFRFFKGKPIKQFINPSNGYLQFNLSKHHKSKTFYTHKLVCLLFNGNKPNDNYVVNHKDSNKLNCYYKNLEWITYSENNIHSYTTVKRKVKGGPGFAEPMIVIYNKKVIEHSSMRDVVRNYKISSTQAWRIVDTEKVYNNNLKIYRKNNLS